MKRISILCCTDDKYAPYYGIMLTSLFGTNKEETFDIYILSSGLGKEIIHKFEKLTSKYHADIHFIEVDASKLDFCPIREGDHVSLAAYYRILAPLVLPDNLKKVLYLDGDIIINGAIHELWNTDLEGFAIGAIIDEAYHDKEKYDRLKIDHKFPYINSGVLLINLDYWRKHDIVKRCLEYINNMQDVLLHHDQDTLNVVLHDEIKLLPLTFNYQYGFVINFLFNQLGDDVKEEVMKIRYNPVVVHFSGPYKPWQRRSRYPYAPLFLYYKNHSLWKNIPLEGKFTIREDIHYYFNKLIWWLHIKKEFNSYIVERQYKK